MYSQNAPAMKGYFYACPPSTMPGQDGLGLNDGQHRALHTRDSQTHTRRSTGVNLGRLLVERCSTPIWWRRAKFSS